MKMPADGWPNVGGAVSADAPGPPPCAIKVLYVSMGFYPAVQMGGVVSVTYSWTRLLAERGHEVHVACSNRINRRRKLFRGTRHALVDGVHVHYFDTHVLPWWPGTFGPALSLPMLVWLIRSVRAFDVVHIHEFRTFPTLVAALACWLWRVPYVLHPHGSLPRHARRTRLKQAYDLLVGHRILHRAREVIAMQDQESQTMLALGVRSERIRLVPNGVDADVYGAAERGYLRGRLRLSPETTIALFLGRLHPMKGPDILIRARVLAGMKAVHLVLAGPDQGFGEECRRLVAELGLESCVSFVETLDKADVPRALADADVFVLPSRFDACPLALLEAAAAAAPIVLSEDCQMLPYFAEAALPASPTPEAIAAAVGRLVADKEYAYALGTRARQLVQERFSAAGTCQLLERIYLQQPFPQAAEDNPTLVQPTAGMRTRIRSKAGTCEGDTVTRR